MQDYKIRDKIEELGPWYQTIDFGEGVRSKGISSCGDSLWREIRPLLPESLKGIRILDIGSNAGIYCVRAALEGADVIGIEHSEKWVRQANFVREYFEKKHGRKLPIRCIQSRVEDIKEDLGKFDIVIATAVLYYVKKEEQEQVVKWICSVTENVIARYRGSVRMNNFNPLFIQNGFGIRFKGAPEGKKVYYLTKYVKNK